MAAQYEQKRKLLDYFCTQTLSPLPHLHKELELIYVRSGASKAVVNNKTYHLKSGDLLLAFPYQVHYYPESKPGEYYVHAFPASVLVTMGDMVNSNELINNVFHPEASSPVIGYLESIVNVQGAYEVSQRCAFLTLIMAQLLPSCKLLSLTNSSGMTTRRILEYCAKHYQEDLSLDTLARELHLSKYYISHTISKQLNMRISTFINVLRIEAACRLLQHNGMLVSEVAQAVGYETIRSFNRAFADIVHMTPKKYRAQFGIKPTDA